MGEAARVVLHSLSSSGGNWVLKRKGRGRGRGREVERGRERRRRGGGGNRFLFVLMHLVQYHAYLVPFLWGEELKGQVKPPGSAKCFEQFAARVTVLLFVMLWKQGFVVLQSVIH